MKQPIKLILGGALLLALPMFLTSCEDILGEWSKPAPAPAPVKTAGEISYASATLKKATRDQTFIFDLTNTGDGTVTYSSSNTAVATIDAATGEVTPVAAGTTTITATVSDSESYTYAVKAQSYDLTLVAGYSYLKWNGTDALTEAIIADGDYTEVTSTSIPASWTAATPSIAAGTYVINDDVTIDGVAEKIEIGGEVNLIIVDGKELIINDQLKDDTPNADKLNIYGQNNQTGKLISSNPGDGMNNIKQFAELNIHSAQVTMTYVGSMGSAVLGILKLNVYGGSFKVDASGGENGIRFDATITSELNVYGGKVTVIGKNYAIGDENTGSVLTVNGGEFYAYSNSYSAITGTKVTLNFASELTGKAGAYADGWETEASWGTSIATGYTGTDRCVKVTQ